jgi:hypothetical protein
MLEKIKAMKIIKRYLICKKIFQRMKKKLNKFINN